MKKAIIFLSMFLVFGITGIAQVGINADNSAPDQSAGLDVKFDNKGFLPPRMTFEQRNAIQNPVEGLMVFCNNCDNDGTGVISIFKGGKWLNLTWGCTIPVTPATGIHMADVTQITWNWNAVPVALGYKWNTVNNYATATDMVAATSKIETGLTCQANYTRYAWAYNDCGQSPALAMTQATLEIPLANSPVAGTHSATNIQIIWNWNTVSGATGYKWNTIDDYTSATNMGTAVTKTETGLTCSSAYTRYVWAYNTCGNSTAVSLTQSTTLCCSTEITINHIAGVVAPVTKSVTYGIVTNISGEPSKCWITRNLGAAQQATVVSDATEASAGWYFQFNRKQGYQYISSRIPAITWINSISEISNWISASDPCSIELGAGWRIPTSAEWNNVNAGGGWTDWNGPYGSALKLHAAGYLNYSDGALLNRGLTGYSWSSTQFDATLGWLLYFGSGHSYEFNFSKAYGFSIRCLRDN